MCKTGKGVEHMAKRKFLLPRLDDYCRQILLVLIIVDKKIRFNELNEFLEKNRIFISKPTLSLHLKQHLVQEKKLVIRKVEEAQNVSYEIDHTKFGESEQNVSSLYRTVMHALTQDKKAFDDAPIDNQMFILLLEAYGRILRTLKLKIELRSNPGTFWGKSLELALLSSPFFEHYEEWLVEKSEEDREYRDKILEKISGLIKQWEERTEVKEQLNSDNK
jgi:DNA-binding HxlR family transcriptional regulator